MSDRVAEMKELRAKLSRLRSEILQLIEAQQAAGRLLARLTAEADQLESQVKDLASSCD